MELDTSSNASLWRKIRDDLVQRCRKVAKTLGAWDIPEATGKESIKGEWKANKFCSHWDSKEGKKCKPPSSFWTHDISPVSDRVLSNESDIPILLRACSYFTGRTAEIERGHRLQWDVAAASIDCQIYLLLIHMHPWGIPMSTLEGGPGGHHLRIKANSLPGLMISSSSLNVTREFFRFRFGLWMSKFPSSMVSVEILLLWAVLNSVRF